MISTTDTHQKYCNARVILAGQKLRKMRTKMIAADTSTIWVPL